MKRGREELILSLSDRIYYLNAYMFNIYCILDISTLTEVDIIYINNHQIKTKTMYCWNKNHNHSSRRHVREHVHIRCDDINVFLRWELGDMYRIGCILKDFSATALWCHACIYTYNKIRSFNVIQTSKLDTLESRTIQILAQRKENDNVFTLLPPEILEMICVYLRVPVGIFPALHLISCKDAGCENNNE